jgi:hypothetical protein
LNIDITILQYFAKPIDRDERLCDLCDHSELGDEFHYLYNCTFLAEERKTYLLQVRNVISFKSLMNNSDDRFVLIGLAKYYNTQRRSSLSMPKNLPHSIGNL